MAPSFIEFRTPVERIKLVNPTQHVFIFNISTYTPNDFRITPTSGRMDPNKEFEFRVELISTADSRQIYDTLHETGQFCFEWIELPMRTPMVEWINQHPESVRNGTAIGDLRNYFAPAANEDAKWTVVQEATINARFSAAMVWTKHPRASTSPRGETLRPTTSISATASCLRTNIGGDALAYRHPLRPGASVPLQLANISPRHIVLYKWLIASPRSPLFDSRNRYCVRPHSGRIDPEMETRITFVMDAQQQPSEAAIDEDHSEKFMLRWVEVERGTEIGNWVERELTAGGTDRARWVDATYQRWGNQVKVHEWRMRTVIGETIVEEEDAIKQEKGSPKSNRLSFRCVVGQSIGLYQWNVKIE